MCPLLYEQDWILFEALPRSTDGGVEYGYEVIPGACVAVMYVLLCKKAGILDLVQ